MQNDELKSLFDDFKPQLSDNTDFMARLERNINAVESIKSESRVLRRNFKRAVTVAAVVGVIAGWLMSAILPTILSYASSLFNLASIPELADTFKWLIVGSLSVLIAFVSYNLSLGMQTTSR